MDKPHAKPLHCMSRMDAISALQQTRSALLDARQRIKDLEGEVQALIEAGDGPMLYHGKVRHPAGNSK